MNRLCAILLLIVGTMVNAYSGVVVEGKARGIDPVGTVRFLPEKNVFIINEDTSLYSPVSSEALLELIDAINLDERIGVSVTLNDELIVYGKLHKRSETSGMLETADNFIRSVVFAEYSRLRKYVLPQNYKPEHVVSRGKSSVIFLQLSDFEYTKNGSQYIPQNPQADFMLIPMATYTAPDGGYLPDYDALEKGSFQQEDKANADHMSKYKNEYLQLPPLQGAIKVGQASALIRLLRDSGINMSELRRSIIEGEEITLRGKAALSDMESVAKGEIVPKKMNNNSEMEQEEMVQLSALASEAESEVANEEIVPVVPVGSNNYAESIRQVFLIDKIIGNTGKVKLSRKSVNDGSYVKYRERYLQEITDSENIDLSKTPEEFQVVFKKHIQAWEHVLAWLDGKNIAEGKDAFAEFYSEHGRFREELKKTYNDCKLIADKYQYQN